MKATKTILLVAGIIGLLFGPTLTAWGGGTPAGGGNPSCQVPNPDRGAIALRGTAAVEALSIDNVATNVDLTLRLERGGDLAFFRHTISANIFGLSNEDIACLFLAEMSQEILTAFGLPTTRTLVITGKSITKDDLPGEIPPGTGRGSSMGDITIWAQ